MPFLLDWAEPMTEQSILKTIALISAFSVALFGVDYYSLLYAFIGSLLMLSNSQPTSRWVAVGYVVLSAIAGAALGSALVASMGLGLKVYLIVACLVAGGGAHRIVAALLGRWLLNVKGEEA